MTFFFFLVVAVVVVIVAVLFGFVVAVVGVVIVVAALAVAVDAMVIQTVCSEVSQQSIRYVLYTCRFGSFGTYTSNGTSKSSVYSR